MNVYYSRIEIFVTTVFINRNDMGNLLWGIFLCLTEITPCLTDLSSLVTETITSLFLLTTSPFHSYAHLICIWSCSPALDICTKIFYHV